jgi:hypothetical protein
MCFSFYFLSFWDNFSGSDLIDNLQEENSNLGLWPLAIGHQSLLLLEKEIHGGYGHGCNWALKVLSVSGLWLTSFSIPIVRSNNSGVS